MQINIIIVGFTSQGIHKIGKIMASVATREGIPFKAQAIINPASKLFSSIEVLLLRFGEGVFSPRFSQRNADLILSLDYLFAQFFLDYLKDESGVIIVSDLLHCITKSFPTSEDLINLMNKYKERASDLYILKISEINNAYAKMLPLRNRFIIPIAASIGCIYKLGLLPVRREAYLESLKAELKEKDLISIALKVINNIQRFLERL